MINFSPLEPKALLIAQVAHDLPAHCSLYNDSRMLANATTGSLKETSRSSERRPPRRPNLVAECTLGSYQLFARSQQHLDRWLCSDFTCTALYQKPTMHPHCESLPVQRAFLRLASSSTCALALRVIELTKFSSLTRLANAGFMLKRRTSQTAGVYPAYAGTFGRIVG